MISTETKEQRQWLTAEGQLYCFEHCKSITMFGTKEVIKLTRFSDPLPDSVMAVQREVEQGHDPDKMIRIQRMWVRFNKLYKTITDGLYSKD
jgi:hypothetical protein